MINEPVNLGTVKSATKALRIIDALWNEYRVKASMQLVDDDDTYLLKIDEKLTNRGVSEVRVYIKGMIEGLK
jgi:hypothetical protein